MALFEQPEGVAIGLAALVDRPGRLLKQLADVVVRRGETGGAVLA